MSFVQSDSGAEKCEKFIAPSKREVLIPPVGLAGVLSRPVDAGALVIFAHGSGSSRFSPRNVLVANALNRRGIATLLFDLLLPGEDKDRRNVFDVRLLAQRLVDAVRWAESESDVAGLSFGLFGASTGAAAALVAAASLGTRIGAGVSRGGRPDLADGALDLVKTPTLLIVGGRDFDVIELNRSALERLRCEKVLAVVQGATHLFPEPGALEEVVELAAQWFERCLLTENGEPGRKPRS